MLKKIYSSPFQVYLSLFLLSLIGFLSLSSLPISLYPEASKPSVMTEISYGQLGPRQFMQQYGTDIETALMAIKEDSLEVDNVIASYNSMGAHFETVFQWNSSGDKAIKKVQEVLAGLSAQWPKESRDNYGVWRNEEGNGFVAVVFTSKLKNPGVLYQDIKPILLPALSKIKDSGSAKLWYGDDDIRLILNPNMMAQTGLFPRDIETAVQNAIQSYRGGILRQGKNDELVVKFENGLKTFEDLGKIPIKTPNGDSLTLSQIAEIEMTASQEKAILKFNSSKGVILVVVPKSNGDLNQLSIDVEKVLKEKASSLGDDVSFQIIINPSEFIHNSINHVFVEVFLAGVLAVLVLFLFVGNLKNTFLAAIEIPLSIILAFILMKIFNVNINLISLGGLALSAGMNVDASVVVIDSILRAWRENKLEEMNSFDDKLTILTNAVRQVMMPIIGSTLCSLAVFIPLIFINGVGKIILGDLAKTVCFSHGCSAIVALVLVPTLRFHMLRFNFFKDSFTQIKEDASKIPLEKFYFSLENFYMKILNFIFSKKMIPKILIPLSFSLLSLLALAMFPFLSKNIIEKPNTDWVFFMVSSQGNTKMQQMEELCKEYLSEMTSKDSSFKPFIRYTLTQIHDKNVGQLMIRLNNKNDVPNFLKLIEKRFVNTPKISYRAMDWNPARLPLPSYPDLKISFYGANRFDNQNVLFHFYDYIKTNSSLKNFETIPHGFENILSIRPKVDAFSQLQTKYPQLDYGMLAETVQVAIKGKQIGIFPDELNLDKSYFLYMTYPKNFIKDADYVSQFPLKIGNEIVPLKAFMDIKQTREASDIRRENSRESFQILGYKTGDSHNGLGQDLDISKEFENHIKNFKEKELKENSSSGTVEIILEDPAKDLTDSMIQLQWALASSILLIFIILLFFFQNIIQAFIVMAAIPFGISGVIISLFIFKSSFSLNSVLGMILLNGLSVANSILIVDFMNRAILNKDITSKEAALLVTKKRLRPILITSLTTILGMFPLALGLGDGGKVLQPLGISVSGGLWISMIFTLIIVPVMQRLYLKRKYNR